MRRATAPRVAGATVLGLAVAGLTACAGGPWSHSAPSWFTSREPLSPCTSVTVPPGGDGAVPADALACFAAGADRGAELTVGSYTTEGDLIVTYYRARPGITGIAVLIDGTRDSFGAREWTRELCPDATSPDDLGTCTDAG